MQRWPIFSSPFRIWFFSGSLCASLFILPWISQFLVATNWQPLHGQYWWHQHEMIYAITVPFILGFLLTASANWTGESPITPKQTVIIVCLWWLARIAIALNLPLLLIVFLELVPLLTAAALLARLLIRHNNRRNLVMVAMVLLLAVSDAMQLLYPTLIQQWSRFSILVIILLISIFGGRVIPFFTASGLGIAKVLPINALEKTLLVSQFGVSCLLPFLTTNLLLQILSGLVAAGHLWRWVRWQSRGIWHKSLLWGLHLAYLFIVLGWVVVAFRGFDSLSVHALAVGGIGLMAMAFSARISLAHSGRPLKPAAYLSLALLFMVAAVIFRVWIPMLFNVDSVLLQYLVSGSLWTLSFGTFTVFNVLIWFSPRVDGKPG